MKHLTQVQRYQIEGYIKSGYSDSDIAKRLAVHRSSISREIRRNSLNRDIYDGTRAHQLYQEGKRKAGAEKKKAKGVLKEKVKQLIKKEYSPEQITGRLRLKGKPSLSHSCIYELIWEDKLAGGDLFTYLRHSEKRSRKKYGKADKRGSIINRVSIEERPQVVDNKERIGDWEGDTIIGKNHKGAIVTLTERKSNFQLIKKVDSKHADGVAKAIIALLKASKIPVKTITFDNGKEFAKHEQIAKALNTDIYFAHPYTPQENGHVESFHAILGRSLEGKNFESLSELIEDLNEFYDFYNYRRIHGSTCKLPPALFWQQWNKSNIERIVVDEQKRKVRFKLKIGRQYLTKFEPVGNGNLREVLSLIFEGSIPNKIISAIET